MRLATFGLCALAMVGCQPLGSGVATPPIAPASPQPVAFAPPIYLEPNEPEFLPPGTPIVVEPTVVLPPQSAYPPAATPLTLGPNGVPLGPGRAITGPNAIGLPARNSIFDVIPQDGGPISPDFGLPRAPVVENRVSNPLFVPVSNNEVAWDQLADVVTNYFPIAREQPVQQTGNLLTEGYIETPYQVGASILEPWRNDSVGPFNRWQSTLQSIRRKALVTVRPASGGYSVYVTVLKQLEDLPRPVHALSGAAVLRSDGSLPTDRAGNVNRQGPSPFWIDLGRDEPLEQEMLRRIRDRLANPQSPSATPSVF
ncbi:MAG: hypothetical protein AAGJ46_04790 [Planctomycetota bacterium]